jgi:hypothetical protein
MVNRETVRDAMATLLETALVGTGLSHVDILVEGEEILQIHAAGEWY